VGACVAVAKGGVGESAVSSLLLHKLKEKVEKLMVLRIVDSTLCHDNGAVAMLVVNGKPVAQGDITKVGSSIQTASTVKSGDVVIAIVHMIPLFKGIICLRIGELNVVLDECDLA
jgi:hypothetical protein